MISFQNFSHPVPPLKSEAKRKFHKPNRACEGCRASKVRCIPLSESAACERCAHGGRKCIFKHRAKIVRQKRTDVRVKELEKRIEALLSLYRTNTTGSPDSDGTSSNCDQVRPQHHQQDHGVLQNKALGDDTLSVEPQSLQRTTNVCEIEAAHHDELHAELKVGSTRGIHTNASTFPSHCFDEILRVCNTPTQQRPPSLHPDGSGILEILSHFEYAAFKTMGAPHIQNVMQRNGLFLAQEAPFLLHAVQAYSASHLYYLNAENRRYKEKAAYHKQRGLQLYSHALNGPIVPHNMDAIFAACMIFAVLAYNTDKVDPRGSFIFSDDPSTISWLAVQHGFLKLKSLQDLQPYLSCSIWNVLFHESNEQGLYYDIRTGTDGLPVPFIELCEIDASSTDDNNPYHAALRLCMSIMDVNVNVENFTNFISFPGRMKPEFFNLVARKDPVALLIVSYWLSRMCTLEQWWCVNRVKGECLAICAYLDGWPDGRIQRLLEGPIQACGYTSHEAQALISSG